jgi:hypothetical protein
LVLSTPPPLPDQTRAPARSNRGACLGCGLAFAVGIVLASILFVFGFQQISNLISTPGIDDNRNSIVGSAYVGDWVNAGNPSSFIRILPNGLASCQVMSGGIQYSVEGGHASFDRKTGRLAIKFFFFGPTWHVDEAPHETKDGFFMKLDGQTYRRLGPSPRASPSSGISV